MHIYFMGICGTAMGNAALLLREAGHTVSGSDAGVYPPMSQLLKDAGITILPGYNPARLASLQSELVVIGNAQTRGNPEVEWLLQTRALPWTSLPALLGERVLRNRRNLVIAGTHGKTTTTAISTHLLRANGIRSGHLIGGVSLDNTPGAEMGDVDAPFVIEGDEYDSAFFDKRSKFLHYYPNILVVNNLEFDHGDIFRDLADIQRSFHHVVRILPQDGFLLLNGDDANLEPLRHAPWTQVLSVGCGTGNDLRIEDFRDGPHGSQWRLTWRGAVWETVTWSLNGLFNARNAAMGALAAALSQYPDDPTRLKLSALENFRGMRRRMELRGTRGDYHLLEDFAHHPTAIRETLVSLRSRYPGLPVTACFEPRSNTAVRHHFQDAFRDALALADRVWIAPLHRPEAIPEEERLQTDQLAADLRVRGIDAMAHESLTSLETALKNETEADPIAPGVTVVFSNGAFGGILGRLSICQP